MGVSASADRSATAVGVGAVQEAEDVPSASPDGPRRPVTAIWYAPAAVPGVPNVNRICIEYGATGRAASTDGIAPPVELVIVDLLGLLKISPLSGPAVDDAIREAEALLVEAKKPR